MMEQYTTYTVKAKTSTDVWVFKYHLNGILYEFKVLDGMLSKTQAEWLFMKGNFPYVEGMIGEWAAKLKQNFTITVGLPDLSFESFWEAYGNKVRKIQTQAAWKKLKDADRLKALEGVRRYDHHLQRNTWKNKMDPNRFLKERRWLDEF